MELAIVLTIVVVALIWVAVRGWKALGRSEQQARNSLRTGAQAKRGQEIDEETADLSDDELNRRLRGDDS